MLVVLLPFFIEQMLFSTATRTLLSKNASTLCMCNAIVMLSQKLIGVQCTVDYRAPWASKKGSLLG
jgi:hypothetical protein